MLIQHQTSCIVFFLNAIELEITTECQHCHWATVSTPRCQQTVPSKSWLSGRQMRLVIDRSCSFRHFYATRKIVFDNVNKGLRPCSKCLSDQNIGICDLWISYKDFFLREFTKL